MRKCFVWLAGLCIAAGAGGCSTHQQIFTTHSYGVDYFHAGLDGQVFITESNSVSFEYVPIGSLYVYQTHGYVKGEEKGKVNKEEGDPIYGTTNVSVPRYKLGSYKFATLETAVRAAAEEALEMGGDGIINLKLSIVHNKDNYKVIYPAVEGMVIKRK